MYENLEEEESTNNYYFDGYLKILIVAFIP